MHTVSHMYNAYAVLPATNTTGPSPMHDLEPRQLPAKISCGMHGLVVQYHDCYKHNRT